jgi:hypothetical protein
MGDMKGERWRMCVVLTTIAAVAGACGKIGYDQENVDSRSAGTTSVGSVIVGAGGALGTLDATETRGALVGGAGATIMGTDGSLATGGSTASAGAGGGSGAGGTSGAIDAGTDTGSSTCDYAAPFSLVYRHYSDAIGQINVGFKLVNNSARGVALRDYKVRYFLTNELTMPTASIVYGDDCCPDRNIINHVFAVVVAMNPPASNADMYIEVSFDGGAENLNPGHAVEVEVELRGAGLTRPNQANDYSYIATANGTQAHWDSCPASGNCDAYHTCVMTALASDVLIWGYPP